MEGLTSMGAFPLPLRREGQPGGRSCRKPDMDPKGQSRSSAPARAGGPCAPPQGPAEPIPGDTATASSPQKRPPTPSSPPSTHRQGWPCSQRAGCCLTLACKTWGAERLGPPGQCPPPPLLWVGGPHAGETLAFPIPHPTHLMPARSWRWLRLLRTVRRLARTWGARGGWGQADPPETPSPALGAGPCPLLARARGQHPPGQTV